MALGAMRSLNGHRFRAFRQTLLGTLGMAAIVLGLLAMHSSGAEHGTVPPLPVANTQAADVSHAEASVTAVTAGSFVLLTAATSAVQCDDACMHAVTDCALMVMTCAMLLAFAALIVFARRPATYRRLIDAGGRVAAFIQSIPLQFHRPDLILLSISRT